MMSVYRITCCLLLLALSGCSTATPYQERGLSGGVEYNQLREDVVEVHSSGNGFTSILTVKNYAMLKGAELCLASGYKFMSIQETGSTTNQLGASSVFMRFQLSHEDNGSAFDCNFVHKDLGEKYL